MPKPSMYWDVLVKIAVEAATDAEARSIVDLVADTMRITTAGSPPLVHFDDGTWATEIHVDWPTYDEDEPDTAFSVLASVKVNLGPVSWRGASDTPDDPDSARVAQIEWPPSYWALAGRTETLVHPAVRAVLLQARRINGSGTDETAGASFMRSPG